MKKLNETDSSCTMSNVETQYMIVDLGGIYLFAKCQSLNKFIQRKAVLLEGFKTSKSF